MKKLALLILVVTILGVASELVLARPVFDTSTQIVSAKKNESVMVETGRKKAAEAAKAILSTYNTK